MVVGQSVWVDGVSFRLRGRMKIRMRMRMRIGTRRVVGLARQRGLGWGCELSRIKVRGEVVGE